MNVLPTEPPLLSTMLFTSPSSSKENTHPQMQTRLMKRQTSVIHVNSYAELTGSFATPERQRPLVLARVEEIRKYFQDCISKNVEPVIGVISIVDVVIPSLRQSYCIDGQHRLEALRLECENDNKIPFYVMKYTTTKVEKVDEYFLLVNKNVPLANYLKDDDTDDDDGNDAGGKKESKNFKSDIEPKKIESKKTNKKLAGLEIRNLCKDIEVYIRKLPLFHDTSVRRPHINVTDFMNHLRVCQHLGTKIKDLKSFQQFLINGNIYLKSCLADSGWLKSQSISIDQKFFVECHKHNNYMCLDKTFAWMNFSKLVKNL